MLLDQRYHTLSRDVKLLKSPLEWSLEIIRLLLLLLPRNAIFLIEIRNNSERMKLWREKTFMNRWEVLSANLVVAISKIANVIKKIKLKVSKT